MAVRNEEKKAFRDLTPEERGEIVEALLNGAGIDVFLHPPAWYKATGEHVKVLGIYRTRPRQLVIPWKVIRPEYKWAAMDCDDVVVLHKSKPEKVEAGFVSDGEAMADILNIDTSGVYWRESLTERPDGV